MRIIPVLYFTLCPNIKKVSIFSPATSYGGKPPSFPATLADHPAKNQHASHRTSPFEYSSLGRRCSRRIAFYISGTNRSGNVITARNPQRVEYQAEPKLKPSLTIVPPGHCYLPVSIPRYLRR